MRVTTGVRAEEVRQAARFTLFVEGSEDGIDPTVLGELLGTLIDVRALGGAEGIEAAARALHAHHPDYYFLVDRDHRESSYVERTWRRFPDPAQSNLLIWRRRELENYFIEPGYLSQCPYCLLSEEELTVRVLREASARLPLDAANLTIARIREKLRTKWIDFLRDPASYPTVEAARDLLGRLGEFTAKKRSTAQVLRLDRILRRFDDIVAAMTGGEAALEPGRGRWLELLNGKPIFRAVVHGGQFEAIATDGRRLDGRDLEREVVRSLLGLADAHQPVDFVAVRQMIEAAVTA